MGDSGKGFSLGNIEKKPVEQVGYGKTIGYPHQHTVAQDEAAEYQGPKTGEAGRKKRGLIV